MPALDKDAWAALLADTAKVLTDSSQHHRQRGEKLYSVTRAYTVLIDGKPHEVSYAVAAGAKDEPPDVLTAVETRAK